MPSEFHIPLPSWDEANGEYPDFTKVLLASVTEIEADTLEWMKIIIHSAQEASSSNYDYGAFSSTAFVYVSSSDNYDDLDQLGFLISLKFRLNHCKIKTRPKQI